MMIDGITKTSRHLDFYQARTQCCMEVIHLDDFHTMWGPRLIAKLVNKSPMNAIAISSINHIVIGVMFTNLAIVNGGLTL